MVKRSGRRMGGGGGRDDKLIGDYRYIVSAQFHVQTSARVLAGSELETGLVRSHYHLRRGHILGSILPMVICNTINNPGSYLISYFCTFVETAVHP